MEQADFKRYMDAVQKLPHSGFDVRSTTGTRRRR